MHKNWWKEEVIYQIYPRSFKDSNGDGIGDLQGIISKLDYLKELGVDIIWISPFYKSPNDDNGYDISDYRAIGEEYGSMEDFDELLHGIHQRGMKLIMDLVVNHTSDEHEWFVESKKSKDNPYRDYYFWRDGKDGKEPTNWPSFFSGNAWEHDPNTDQYYMHLFTKKQPDLNWENPKVREEVYDIVQFWLDKGIDGFRLDVIPLISKTFPLASTEIPVFNDIVENVYSNGPRVHEFINEMYTRVLSKYDIMTVGEGPGINKDVANLYVGKDRGELNMIFHLDHMFLGHGTKGKFDPYEYGWKEIKILFNDWEHSIGDDGWISIFLDNHDFPRLVSRFGNDDQYRIESAKALALMIFTLRGTPCIYQGSEIGMTNVAFETIDDYRDVETLNFYKDHTAFDYSNEKRIALIHEHGRDNARTTMQWDDSVHGGFSSQNSWIKPNPNYRDINVQKAISDPDSIFHWYKKIIAYRKTHLGLTYGNFTALNKADQPIYIYKREWENESYLVVINHSNEKQSFDIPTDGYKLELINQRFIDSKVLQAWEARLYYKA